MRQYPTESRIACALTPIGAALLWVAFAELDPDGVPAVILAIVGAQAIFAALHLTIAIATDYRLRR